MTALANATDELQLSVVRLHHYNQPSRTCGTGFWLSNDGLIATCAHVIPTRLRTPSAKGDLGVACHALNWSGSAHLQQIEPTMDIAVLRVNDTLPHRVHVLPLNREVVYGHQFRSFGYRKSQHFTGLDTRGEIRARTLSRRGDVWAEVIQLYSDEIEEGMSGAPIFDLEVQAVVGIVSLFWRETTTTTDSRLMFGVPVAGLLDLMPHLGHRFQAEARGQHNYQIAYVRTRVPFPTYKSLSFYVPRTDSAGKDLVTEIARDMDGSAHHIFSICGAGGVGKSTVAYELCRRLFTVRFPDGIVWVTADGRSSYDLHALLDDILIELGEQTPRSASVGTRIERVYDFTRTKSILLVVDNFETIADHAVVEFLSRFPSQVLVTTRHQVDRDGWKHYYLRDMKRSEAIQFIRSEITNSAHADRLADHDPSMIYNISGGNPMLMRWTLARLEQMQTLEDVVEILQSGEGDAVDRVFNRSFQLLDPDSKSLILCISLFVPSCSIELLEGFLQLPRRRLMSAISTLSSLALVDRVSESGRLILVPATRYAARAKLEQNPREYEAILQSFVDLVLGFVRSVHDSGVASMLRLKTEEKNIFEAMDWALHLNLPLIVVDFVRRLGGGLGFLDLHSSWPEAMSRLTRALMNVADPSVQAELKAAYFHIGRGYFHVGEYDQASHYYTLALEHYLTIDDSHNAAFVLLHMGRQERLRSHHEEALAHFVNGLRMSREHEDLRIESIILNEIGVLRMQQGLFAEAESELSQSRKIKIRLGDINAAAISQYQLGNLALLDSKLNVALEHYEAALVVFEAHGNLRDQASCLAQIGWLQFQMGEDAAAGEFLRRAADLFRDLGDDRGRAKSHCYLGILSVRMLAFEEARTQFEMATTNSRRLRSPELDALIEYGYGLLQLGVGDRLDGRTRLQRSVQYFREIKHPMSAMVEASLREEAGIGGQVQGGTQSAGP